MPVGADTVYMQEDVEIAEDGTVLLPSGLARGANVRLAGEDIPQGSVALPKGRRMRPQDVALAAALGLTELAVRRKPRDQRLCLRGGARDGLIREVELGLLVHAEA